jgi:pSer/pThr/pTyr-binding forkhead associated (FHA) protein
MPRVLRLTVLTGPHRNQRFCFCGTTRCLMGRSSDCYVQLMGEAKDQSISRCHCEMTLDCSSLTLRDMSSKYGTYLDGKQIGTAILSLPNCNNCSIEAEEFSQGSLLNMGGTTFALHVVDCPPEGTSDSEKANLWRHGETAKNSCPLDCL